MYDGDNARGCFYCNGSGTFDAPDMVAIIDSLIVKRKKGNHFRKSRPKYQNSVWGNRQYFVWRIARFHGGADVCMPVCAEMDIAGDPYRPELEKLAESLAKAAFGTDLAAAYRWGRLLVNDCPEPPKGLPATAYSCGPVVLDSKPASERIELDEITSDETASADPLGPENNDCQMDLFLTDNGD
jgi:hypothetical protein